MCSKGGGWRGGEGCVVREGVEGRRGMCSKGGGWRGGEGMCSKGGGGGEERGCVVREGGVEGRRGDV